MNMDQISPGKNPPQDVNVIIEIPYGGAPIKYEMDKKSGALFVDRFLGTAMYYPAHYGFVPQTLSQDGDPIDALVVGRTPILPGVVIPCRPLGVLVMEDESGLDEKILFAPLEKIDPYHKDWQDIHHVPQILKDQISHFFERYKDLEHGKWVKITGWKDKKHAEEFITQSIERFKGGK
jgi:inorganic pyrophosphatase